MEILKFILKPKLVTCKINNDSSQGQEIRTTDSPEKPMPSAFKAIHDLTDVVLTVMELPLTWAGPDDARTLTPYGFDMSYTAAGTRSIKVHFKKAFRCGKVESFTTPLVQIDDPAEGEDEKSAMASDERCLCNAALAEATQYVGGLREQMTMEGIHIGRVDDADTDQEEIPLD